MSSASMQLVFWST